MTNTEQYKADIIRNVDLIADLINQGCIVEISRSRSGIKVYSTRPKHHVINHSRADRGEEGGL